MLAFQFSMIYLCGCKISHALQTFHGKADKSASWANMKTVLSILSNLKIVFKDPLGSNGHAKINCICVFIW